MQIKMQIKTFPQQGPNSRLQDLPPTALVKHGNQQQFVEKNKDI